MRLLSVLATACAMLVAASALPVSDSPYDIRAYNEFNSYSSREVELLEARGKKAAHRDSKKHVPPPPPAVTFVKGTNRHYPDNHLNRLQLHGDKRKAVEKWHVNLVHEKMKTVQGAHSAEIVNMAHAIGSTDPHIHVSAIFRDREGRIIQTPQRGNGVLRDTAHIYANQEHPEDGYQLLPLEYKKAMDKNAAREGRHGDVGRA